MGTGKELLVADLRRRYKGYPHLLKALLDAHERAWRVIDGGHGVIVLCPLADRSGCRRSIPGSPRNDATAAKQLDRFVDACSHQA